MSLEAKIKALLEGSEENLLSEEELVESVVELDKEGNVIRISTDDDNDKDDNSEDDDTDQDDNSDVDDSDKDDNSEDDVSDKACSKTSKSNMKEHIEALVSGEDLSEEFKVKAAVILEAAIADSVEKELKRLEEEHEYALNAMKEQLVEDIDGFLNVIVERWMEENKLALERGIKVDIVENFIDGMKTLFKEHYIEVPEEKLNVLDEQAAQIEALLEANAELSNSVQELTEDVNTTKKALAIEEIGSDLTDTDFEKFSGLLENVEYSDNFETKARTILESYFPKTKVKTSDIVVGDGKEIEVPAEMNKYVEALSGQLKF